LDEAWGVYQDMLKNGMEISIVAFNTLIDACARCAKMSRVPQIVEDMVKFNCEPNLITYSSFLKGYCQENQLDKAFEVLETMKRSTKFKPDEIMYNSLLDGCARQALYERGVGVLEDMLKAGVPPSNFTLSVLVKLASRGKKLQKAFDYCHDLSRKYNIRLNVHVYSNLIHACINLKELARAFETFHEMLKNRVRPDVRTYTLLLRACCESKHPEDIKRTSDLFRQAIPQRGESTVNQPQCGLPLSLVQEVFDVAARRNEDLAADLAKLLRSVPGFRVEQSLKFRLATRARGAK